MYILTQICRNRRRGRERKQTKRSEDNAYIKIKEKKKLHAEEEGRGSERSEV